jgi:uncharacterized membrane protein YhhN
MSQPGSHRSRVADVLYALLAIASIAVIPLGLFPGLPSLRMAPTVLLAFTALRRTRQNFGTTIAWGLALGACGDYVLSTFNNDIAVLGVLAFFAGHVCYITGLRRSGWDPTPLRRAIVAMLAVFGLAYGFYIAWVNPHVTVQSIAGVPVPDLSLPVAPALLAYMPLLIAMACVAVLRRGSRLLAFGALVFVVSDALIPLNQFLLPKAHPGDLYATPWLVGAGFFTYYLAQYLIERGAQAESPG